jgi:hypothetical protein
MIHSPRWLGPLIFTAAVLVLADAAAQGSAGAPSAEPQAPRDSAAASEGDKAAAKEAAEDPKADNFDRTPTSCITLSNIKQTAIVDDSTILFYMRGGSKPTYRTRLAHECPNLEREGRFRYTTTMNRLCDSDLITVLEQFGAGLRDGFSCRLGSFYPIPYDEAELLRKEHDKPGSTRSRVKTKPAEVAPKSEAPPAPEPAAQKEQAPAGEQTPPHEETGDSAPR